MSGIELVFFGLGIMLTETGRMRDKINDSHAHKSSLFSCYISNVLYFYILIYLCRKTVINSLTETETDRERERERDLFNEFSFV